MRSRETSLRQVTRSFVRERELGEAPGRDMGYPERAESPWDLWGRVRCQHVLRGGQRHEVMRKTAPAATVRSLLHPAAPSPERAAI